MRDVGVGLGGGRGADDFALPGIEIPGVVAAAEAPYVGGIFVARERIPEVLHDVLGEAGEVVVGHAGEGEDEEDEVCGHCSF